MREHRRSRQEQATLLAEQFRLERGHRARGCAIERHQPEWRRAVQRAHEGMLAHRVIDHARLAPVRGSNHLLHPVRLRIVDGDIAPRRAGHFALLGRAGGTDHGGAERLGPAAEDLPYAARGGVHQYDVAGLHAMRLAHKVLGGHGLEEDGRGGEVDNAVG